MMNPLQVNVPFPYHLKSSKCLWHSDSFLRYRKETLSCNRLAFKIYRLENRSKLKSFLFLWTAILIYSPMIMSTLLNTLFYVRLYSTWWYHMRYSLQQKHIFDWAFLINYDDLHVVHFFDFFCIIRWINICYWKQCNIIISTYPRVRVLQSLSNKLLFLPHLSHTSRSSHQRCSLRKSVLRNFAKFTGKHLCQTLFFNKVAGLIQQLY